MSNYISHGELGIAKSLYDLVNEEVCPNTNVEPEQFWTELEGIIKDFAPRIKAHLATRDDMQAKIDQWHRENNSADAGLYKKHLTDIGMQKSQRSPVHNWLYRWTTHASY